MAEGWDILDGSAADITRPRVYRRIRRNIKEKRYFAMSIDFPCNTFSRARKNDGRGPPPLRSDQQLLGLPNLSLRDRERVKVANDLFDKTLDLLRCALEIGMPIVLENPKTSRLWLMPPLIDIIEEYGGVKCEMDYCTYGCPQ